MMRTPGAVTLLIAGLQALAAGGTTASCYPSVRGPQTAASRPPGIQKPWERPRLPDTLKPLGYELRLWPQLSQDRKSGLFVFHGRSTVTFLCRQPTRHILVHSKALSYTKHPRVTGRGGSAPAVGKFWQESAGEYLVVLLEGHLDQGKVYSLHTAFSGELASDMAGLYYCQYQQDGSTRFLAVTMMQPANARRVFPCFDDPALKATFDLTVVHRPQHTAVSNMPVRMTSEMRVHGQLWMVTRFHRTPLMSSYLLACVVSDFPSIAKTFNKVTVRVWARKQAMEAGQGDYALETVGRLLHFYEEKFQILYPLRKLDLVAVPCFESGAMENWGLVIFREINLLFQPQEDSESTRQDLQLVLAHELVHQWFGNLVTINWWNDLWLNEGFATYFSYLGNAFISPERTADSVFVGRSLRISLESDAQPNSHPLSVSEQEVGSNQRVSQLFNDISYEKGASVLRMASNFMTENVFLQGLLAMNNQSATTLPTNLKSILDSWALQPGYPLVTVNTSSGLVSQRHFLLYGLSTVSRPSRFRYRWYIPVTWQLNTSLQDMIWINRTRQVYVSQVVVRDQTWALANINAVGVYRVNYDDDNWDRLLIQLMRNRDAIPVINRAQLIDDAFSLARGKHIRITRALETTRYLHMETESLPWDTLSTHLDFMELVLRENPAYNLLEEYVLSKVSPVFDYMELLHPRLRSVPSEGREQFAQEVVVGVACSNGLRKCNVAARDLFSRWMAQPDVNPIPPSLLRVVCCRSVAEGDQTEWNFAWKMYDLAESAAEAQTLRYCLACSANASILARSFCLHSPLRISSNPQAHGNAVHTKQKTSYWEISLGWEAPVEPMDSRCFGLKHLRYLSFTMMPWEIKRQDTLATIVLVAQNINGKKPAWDFIKASWSNITSEFNTMEAIMGLIEGVTSRFATEEDLRELEEFKQFTEVSGFLFLSRFLDRAIKRTASYIQWRKENEQEIFHWVNNNL
ncbi:aminopeptidase N-like isoform X2 [Mobula birostris]|uniref:aminopeptidase N-like isoform X2 n=1 Tax=Mobula birostris TaxID=1983395 RepID=UPI003B2831AD